MKQPCFNHMRPGVDYRIASDLQHTDFIVDNIFWIGTYPDMGDEMTDYLVDRILECGQA